MLTNRPKTQAEGSLGVPHQLPQDVELRVFDSIGVVTCGEPASIGGRRQRRLLALLAIRANSVVTTDWLTEYLWADHERPSGGGAAALRTYVSRLRHALPESAQGWVETATLGYRLTIPPGQVEHLRFRSLRAQARRARERGEVQLALRLLDDALSLWRGDPFRELEDIDWALAETEGLRLEHLEMQEERWEVALALGLHTQVLGELATFNLENRLRERARRQHALALHRSGRTHEALRVLQDYRDALVEGQGLDPSPALAELESALLQGDVALDVESAGRPLRGYRLLERIGEGAFSEVWRGIQPSVNREVAIKQIRAELAAQPDFIRRFEAEAQTVARIEHPHIVPLIDFWRDPDSAYLVMRWLRGGTLEEKLAGGALSTDTTVRIAQQVGSALGAAHAHGVIHRDVKSANIFLDEEGNGFLGDFGIAVDVAADAAPHTTTYYGSPAYASPEQLQHSALAPSSDVFSLGVVLFECLTGSLPFRHSNSAEELVEHQLNLPFPLITELRPDLSTELAEVIQRATAKLPADRFETVADLVAALEAASSAGQGRIAPTAAIAPTVASNPYRGLRSFDSSDAGVFFGRDQLVDELVTHLQGDGAGSRALVVVGPSGSGKSSVVNAGLLPALRNGVVEGAADWFTTWMVPGTDPYGSLEGALRQVAIDPPDSLLTILRGGVDGIAYGVRRCVPRPDNRVLLVIDQLEEIFSEQGCDADVFLSAITQAVERPDSQLILVATLRADFYDRPLQHSAFSRVMKRGAIDVAPLTAEEMEQAVRAPATLAGLTFEPGLVAHVVADTVGQPSPLPLMQYALSEVFDYRKGSVLTGAAYTQIGGLSGALAATAERIYCDATEREQQAARYVFERMTSASEDRIDLRRRVRVADLGHEPQVQAVLDRFGAARLITFDRDPGSREPTVEVAHEALLREWPRLVMWLEEDRDLLRSADAVAAAAEIWEEGGREPLDLLRGGRLDSAVELHRADPSRLRRVDNEFIEESATLATATAVGERRRVQRLRNLAIGFAAAMVLAMLAGGAALVQQRRADEQAASAVQSSLLAEDQRRLAEEQTRLATDQRILADEREEIAAAALNNVDTLTDELENLIIIRGVGDAQADRLLDLASTIDFATAPQNTIEVTALDVIEVTDKSAKVRFDTSECSDAIWTVSHFGSAGGVALDRCSDSHQLLLGRAPFSSGPLVPDTTYTVDVAGVLDDGSRSAAGRVRFTTLPEYTTPPAITDLTVSEITTESAVVTFKVDQCTGAQFTIDGVVYHADGYPGRQDLCWVNQWARVGTMSVGPGPLEPNTTYTVEVQAFLVDGDASASQSIEFTTLG